MVRARGDDTSVLALGPVTRAVMDPLALTETKITASARVVTKSVGTGPLDLARRSAVDMDALFVRVAERAADALFDALVARARQASCSLYDVLAPAFRKDLELALVRSIDAELAGVSVVVTRVESLELTMDPKTEAWLRSRRVSARAVVVASPSGDTLQDGESSRAVDITEVAGVCANCAVQVSPGTAACPACGGPIVAPPPCVRCGTSLRPGSRFCVDCGARA